LKTSQNIFGLEMAPERFMSFRCLVPHTKCGS